MGLDDDTILHVIKKMNKVDRARLLKNVDRFTSWRRIIKKSGKEFKEYRSMSFCMWVQLEEKVFLGT